MWKSNEYCSFTSTWECNHDPSYLASYSIAQDGADWNQESSKYEDDVPSSTVLECSQPSDDSSPMELSCSCKLHQNVSIVGAVVACEARTIECYSASDGYIKSARGTAMTKTQNEIEDIKTRKNENQLYFSVIKFEQPLTELTLKFLGIGDRTAFSITRLDLVMVCTAGQARGPGAGIDLDKVKGYLNSMGDSVPEGGQDLLRSVEQYQKTQMSGLGGLQAMFSSLLPHQAGSQPPASLSALLSMMPGTRPASQSHDSESANQDTDKESHDSTGSAQSGRLGSLQGLMAAMTSGDSPTDSAGENKDNMFEMLKGICGRVSQLRVDKAQPAEDTEENQNSEDKPSQPDDSQDKDISENLPAVTGVNLDSLKSVFEQTAAELVRQSEERLMGYIDTRLVAMETRLNNKLDGMMQALQKNGHPLSTESGSSE